MEPIYILEYFIFTFIASLSVIQIALSNKINTRFMVGVTSLFLSYYWFFTARDRNVHTFLEGVQLFMILGLSVVLAALTTKILLKLLGSR